MFALVGFSAGSYTLIYLGVYCIFIKGSEANLKNVEIEKDNAKNESDSDDTYKTTAHIM